MKIWHDSKWFLRTSTNSWCLTEPGEYEVGDILRIQLEINAQNVEALIRSLDAAGWIKPRLDERLRSEDLKITHRLLDIIEKKGKE